MPLDARDRELLEQISSPEQREIVERSLAHHRQEDRLGPGDPVPDLELIGLETRECLSLAAPRERPLVLFFGSYT